MANAADGSAASRATYGRRTFLIDRQFQLKYTAILMVVGGALSILFGSMMYQAHVDATKMMGLPEAFEKMVGNHYDDRLLYIMAGITVVMSIALALFGVLVTHRVAGPVYVIRRYFDALGAGPFPVLRPLRQNDELKDFFSSFQDALERLKVLLNEHMSDERLLMTWFGQFMTEPKYPELVAGIEIEEELLVEEISIDGMCGVY